MRQYETFELTFHGSAPSDSEAQPDIQAKITCGKKIWNIKGFYDGGGVYKVRFLPMKAGTYTWSVSGAVQGAGKEVCISSGTSHGMVQTENTHFVFQDGTRYLPFGTTVYALAHQPDELVRQTLATLEKAPFNKIRLCLFPKHCDYNNNDPEFYPFQKDQDGKWDVNRPDLRFWKRFEEILEQISGMGIQTDLHADASEGRDGRRTALSQIDPISF